MENPLIPHGDWDPGAGRRGPPATRRAISPLSRAFVFHRLPGGLSPRLTRGLECRPSPSNVFRPRPHTPARRRPAGLVDLGVGAPLRLRRPHRAAPSSNELRDDDPAGLVEALCDAVGDRSPLPAPAIREVVDNLVHARLPRRPRQHPRRRLHGARERPRAGDRRPLPRPSARILHGRRRGPRARARRRRRAAPRRPAHGCRRRAAGAGREPRRRRGRDALRARPRRPGPPSPPARRPPARSSPCSWRSGAATPRDSPRSWDAPAPSADGSWPPCSTEGSSPGRPAARAGSPSPAPLWSPRCSDRPAPTTAPPSPTAGAPAMSAVTAPPRERDAVWNEVRERLRSTLNTPDLQVRLRGGTARVPHRRTPRPGR